MLGIALIAAKLNHHNVPYLFSIFTTFAKVFQIFLGTIAKFAYRIILEAFVLEIISREDFAGIGSG